MCKDNQEEGKPLLIMVRKLDYKMVRGAFLQMFEFNALGDCQRGALKPVNMFQL